MAADLACDGSGNIAVLDIVDTINKNRRTEEANDSKNFKNFGIQNVNGDFNTLTKDGVYGMNGVNSNGPLASVFGPMIVITFGGNVLQTVFDYSSDKSWTRRYNGNVSKWTAWSSVLTGTWDGTTLNITI